MAHICNLSTERLKSVCTTLWDPISKMDKRKQNKSLYHKRLGDRHWVLQTRLKRPNGKDEQLPGNQTKNLEVQVWTFFYIRANRIQAQGLTLNQQRSPIIWKTQDTGNLVSPTSITMTVLLGPETHCIINPPKPPSLVQVKWNCGKYHTSYLLTLMAPLKHQLSWYAHGLGVARECYLQWLCKASSMVSQKV